MSQPQLFVKMAIDAWQSAINNTNRVLSRLSDEQLMHEIAPGRNRGIYLLGHLATVHDLMLPLLRLEDALLYPALKYPFLEAADKTVSDIPTAAELRTQWNEVNNRLKEHFEKMSAEDWFTRHNNVNEEDFAKEPHRNRLNVLLSRTNHLEYHRGQLALLIQK
jgi:uncharacterized damage-inducible protein DinB